MSEETKDRVGRWIYFFFNASLVFSAVAHLLIGNTVATLLCMALLWIVEIDRKVGNIQLNVKITQKGELDETKDPS
jgi:hypothetical protein